MNASQSAAPVAPSPWDDPSVLPLVTFDRVTKRFGSETAVDGLSLSIHEREFFALLGPSGCGKSTLMRLLAGFETPTEGRVLLAGNDLAGVPPHQRPVNMMFQSYALFPHMSVEKNVAFGLEMDGIGRDEIRDRVAAMLTLVRLDAYASRKPHQLSGGQRQRVALARALVKRPKVLLLDEPLGALDRKLREETQFELVALKERLGMTFVIVTHDQDEAISMASRIAVMDKGRVVQVAPPRIIYEQPASRYVAGCIGDINMVEGLVAAVDGRRVTVSTELAGDIALECAEAVAVGHRVAVAWRPEKTRLVRGAEPIAGGRIVLPGQVRDVGYLGDWSTYVVETSGQTLRAAVANVTRLSDQPIVAGETVRLVVAPEALILLTR
ncbi:ABC transporter ATP-binding protein [Phreatobacter aquaticus]|uniref:Spermidine/putrescine import ATP-binding protein PotA n=1 Tax=Phreatobacter aquaticus TaxID=2570229 RepID=A0A4D7QAI7_9HYPH|nr:ABC transporter ATP-binding protein [Phreatobacter aquaticus]QCK85100.1 ABC transporter ATP-binding protein [Phreatobacter aquaticus]